MLPKPDERPKFPSGIPRTNLRPAQAGDKFAMLGPEGYVVPELELQASQVVKVDKALFLTEEEEKLQQQQHQNHLNPSSQSSQQAADLLVSSSAGIPKELKCPFGDHLIRDAVLVPCCGHFVCCDECIRHKISMDENIECPHPDCDQEIGSLGSITAYHEMRKKVLPSFTISSSPHFFHFYTSFHVL